MLQSFITVFREVFEISVILSMFLFYTKNLEARKRFIVIGVIAGILGSAIIALFASQITNSLDGRGQEIMNIIILSMSILMISWTIIWMGKNSADLISKIKETSLEVTSGNRPKIILSCFIALTIFREGAEIIMFISGIYAGGADVVNILTGSLIGLILGVVVGVVIYIGFLKIPTSLVFKITSFLLILLASGLSARLANMLAQADILNYLNEEVWDSSWFIDSDSFTGMLIENIFGYYNATPSMSEILFYFITFTLLLFKSRSNKK